MNRYDRKVRNIGILVFVLMLVTSFVLGSGGTSTNVKPPENKGEIFKDRPLQQATAADAGDLKSGETFMLKIPENGNVTKNLTAKLSWSDETNPPGRPYIRRYENQPDTFSLKVILPDGNSSEESGQNKIGGSGILKIPISLDDNVLSDLYENGIAGSGNWTIEVTLVSTGIWKPVLGPGIIGLKDTGNHFSLSVDYEYYQMEGEVVA